MTTLMKCICSPLPFTLKLIALISFFCLSQIALSQSTARQGTNEDLVSPMHASDFMSPMVLEYDLSKLKYLPIKKGKSYFLDINDFSKYECEKVVLEKLQIARRDTDEIGIRELVIIAHLYTKPPKDKLVSIRFDIVNDGKLISSNKVSDVSVEEHYRVTVDVVIAYAKGVFENSSAPALKLVMSVEDD